MGTETGKRYLVASTVVLALSITALLCTWLMVTQPYAGAKGGNALKKKVNQLQTTVNDLGSRLRTAESSVTVLNAYRTCDRNHRTIRQFEGYFNDLNGNTTPDANETTTALDFDNGGGGTVIGYLSINNC